MEIVNRFSIHRLTSFRKHVLYRSVKTVIYVSLKRDGADMTGTADLYILINL